MAYIGSRRALMGGRRLRYLLRDEFSDTRAAGSVNGTPATPGPGTRAVVDVGLHLSVGSGILSIDGGESANGQPALYYGAITRAAGRAVIAQCTPTGTTTIRWPIGWGRAQSGVQGEHALRMGSGGSLQPVDNAGTGPVVGIYEAATPYLLALVLRSTGVFYLIQGGAFTQWTLLWLHGAANAATLYPGSADYNGAYTHDFFRVADLGGPWLSDHGIATQRLAGARGAGDTFAHEADALIEFTVATVPTAGQIEARFRAQDTTNYWQVTVDSAGTLGLDEVVAGTPTQRGTAASVIVAGDRIVIMAAGATIQVYEANSLHITYGSATNFATETSGKLEMLGTGGAVADLVSWPRVMSGTALKALQRYAS